MERLGRGAAGTGLIKSKAPDLKSILGANPPKMEPIGAQARLHVEAPFMSGPHCLIDGRDITGRVAPLISHDAPHGWKMGECGPVGGNQDWMRVARVLKRSDEYMGGQAADLRAVSHAASGRLRLSIRLAWPLPLAAAIEGEDTEGVGGSRFRNNARAGAVICISAVLMDSR